MIKIFNLGLLPSRADLKEQATAAMVVGRLQGAGPPLQEEPEDPLSSPPHQLHQGRLELFQTHHQVSEYSIQMLVYILSSNIWSQFLKKDLLYLFLVQKLFITCCDTASGTQII